MGSPAPQPEPFSLLPPSRTPWSEFVLSYAAQAIIVAVFVWVRLLHPEILEAPKHDYQTIELVPTPPPVNHAPQRRLPQPVMVARLDPPPTALRLAAPQPQPKARVEDAPAPEVKIAEKKPDPMLPATAPIIPRVVRTNVFSTGSSAPQTIARAPEHVQTGGFGDPNGVPVKASQTQAINIAGKGGFDMPVGPGSGNGTGGATGVRGVVASSGFGDGVATAENNHPVQAVVRQAGFGDGAAPAAAQTRVSQGAGIKIIPAEILSKPIPVYTDEARARRIEGEVLLEVVLEATGRIHVVRVVRGLGHGLDDAAVRAAEQIQFKPALRDGRPSDSTAVLHIIFQLA
jgi:TonB family protein